MRGRDDAALGAMLAVPRVALFTNVGIYFFGGLELTVSWQASNDINDMLFSACGVSLASMVTVTCWSGVSSGART